MVLEDLTVLDCSQAGAGPYGAGILAKAGADVINVEPPGGATTREYVGGGWFACSDQRKRSIGVDLTTEASRELMADLVADADVVFHNYMPETAEKLGLDYETLRGYNDAVIVTVVSGFGKDGPYRDRIAYDPIAQAMSGLMDVTGEPDRKPSRVGGSTVDIGTGINAALGTLMALHRREITGEGDRIDATLFDTAAMYLGAFYSDYSLSGNERGRHGHITPGRAPYALLETKTDPVYIAIAQDRQWARFCRLFDREAWIDDDRFATNAARVQNLEALIDSMEAVVADYTQAEVVETLEGRVPVGELQTIAEAATDKHYHERGTLTHVYHPDHDGAEAIATALPVDFEDGSPPTDTTLPAFGEHTDAILDDLGFSSAEVAALRDDGVVH
jgi:crotonobetainyl-CoA:carnitine CoA-transferase CaiB-like acyl-CoA transferase